MCKKIQSRCCTHQHQNTQTRQRDKNNTQQKKQERNNKKAEATGKSAELQPHGKHASRGDAISSRCCCDVPDTNSGLARPRTSTRIVETRASVRDCARLRCVEDLLPSRRLRQAQCQCKEGNRVDRHTGLARPPPFGRRVLSVSVQRRFVCMSQHSAACSHASPQQSD